MARPATINNEMVEAAQEIVQSAKTAKQLRKGLSIVLPSALGVSNATTAQLLGIGSATVVRMQKEIRDQVAGNLSPKGKWGGRRRQLLSIEEEKQFLEPWANEAHAGGVLVVPPIHEALEKRLGRIIPASTIYRMLARHGWRKVAPDTCHPKRDEQAQEDFKKKFHQILGQTAALNVLNLPVRVVFQDEARFGRLSDPRRCWAPAPMRPMVKVALVREYTYAYAAVSPKDGALAWMLAAKMDTLNMSAFLEHVSRSYPEQFVVMVLDGAPSHRSHELRVPDNMALVRLPAYSPELNPAERLWEELREKEFANRVFDSLGAAIAQAAKGLRRLESDSGSLQSLTGWNWILGSS